MENLFHEIELPGITIPGNLFLAPIAGFSDAPFRSIVAGMGASMTFTEMVSCDGLIRNGEKTIALMRRSENEDFLAVQVFTGDPETAFKAMAVVLEHGPAVVDLNCGCPVPKVIKNGAGASLMRDLPRLKEVVSAMADGLKAARGRIPPVSVKIRSGWDSGSLNFSEAAEAAVEAGAAMVSLHPRTRVQGYSGRAEWEHIRILKEVLPVPVIGSGDLFTPEAAREMLEHTGCDGLMFSRGAIGNPWIFRQTGNLLTGGDTGPPPDDRQRTETALNHLRTAVEMHGESRACREMKKHLCSYTKGMTGAAELRNRIVHAADFETYRKIFTEL